MKTPDPDSYSTLFMNTAVKTAAITVLVLTGLTALSSAQAMNRVSDTPLAPFSTQSLDGWSERSFEGNTDYELVLENGIPVLKGHTRKQASILYREENIDLRKTPIINWSWKVDRTFKDIEEKARDGDDFPARLYVVAKTGFLPWETLAINYVWSSQIPVGDSWPNPFTEKARMVSIQSGDTYVGKWTEHSRNVAEDFQTLFNRDIEEIKGYAVMVDGDNAKVDAVAWFGQISFTSDVLAE